MTKLPHGPIAIAAFILECFLSIGALGGGVALMLGPSGQIIPLPLLLLQGSLFENYFWPGVILFVVLGLVPAMVAALVWRGESHAPLMTLVVGLLLLAWLAVEIAIIGYLNHPPLQAFYLLLGMVITSLGATWLTKRRLSAPKPPAIEAAWRCRFCAQGVRAKKLSVRILNHSRAATLNRPGLELAHRYRHDCSTELHFTFLCAGAPRGRRRAPSRPLHPRTNGTESAQAPPA